MKPKEAKAQFKLADDTYRAGRFEEALALLEEIDRNFPGNRNVMFPRARCLAKLGRMDEALVICNLLSEFYDHGKAREFKAQILGPSPSERDGEPSATLGFEGEFDQPAELGVVSRGEGSWLMVALVTLAVGAAIAGGYFVLFLN